MRTSVLFLLYGWVTGTLRPAHAAKHHLFVGTFAEHAIYALEFDDVTLDLTLTANIYASDTHTWISLSHDKKALYGSGIGSGSWYSYAVHNASSVTLSAAVPIVGNCTSALPGGGIGPSGLFITAASTPPYAVYGVGPTCGNVLHVDLDNGGALAAVVQEMPYSSTSTSSGVATAATLMHGMALSSDGRFLYATDARGNSIWTYAVRTAGGGGGGELDLVDVMAGPVPGSNPRHVAVHLNGGYLYVVLEGANALVQYRVHSGAGETAGRPAREWSSWPLIKPGLNLSAYWPDEVMLSPSARYLWATSRGRQAGLRGFISAFRLSDDGSGAIAEQLFLAETTTSGGSANAVMPAPFSDEFVALTDTERGFVQIWRFHPARRSAEVVAEVGIHGVKCCANAVWYD